MADRTLIVSNILTALIFRYGADGQLKKLTDTACEIADAMELSMTNSVPLCDTCYRRKCVCNVEEPKPAGHSKHASSRENITSNAPSFDFSNIENLIKLRQQDLDIQAAALNLKKESGND